MRSTQFDDHAPFEEEAEEQHRRSHIESLCETIKRLGYGRNNQVRLYGKVFDLVSDPVRVGENLVFVDALERESSHVMRVRIPPTIVQMARKKVAPHKRTIPARFAAKTRSLPTSALTGVESVSPAYNSWPEPEHCSPGSPAVGIHPCNLSEARMIITALYLGCDCPISAIPC
jgi:hypothetical protein